MSHSNSSSVNVFCFLLYWLDCKIWLITVYHVCPSLIYRYICPPTPEMVVVCLYLSLSHCEFVDNLPHLWTAIPLRSLSANVNYIMYSAQSTSTEFDEGGLLANIQMNIIRMGVISNNNKIISCFHCVCVFFVPWWIIMIRTKVTNRPSNRQWHGLEHKKKDINKSVLFKESFFGEIAALLDF